MTARADETKIAIVIPWFGRTLKGGAELQAWNLATRLSARGYSLEILTTCCRSFQDDWSVNHLSAGLTDEPEGFKIRRFPVETRNRAEFDRVCGYLLSLDSKSLKPGVSPISDEEERIFCEHLIRCPALLAYLAESGSRYAAFIFIPYLYGPILDGLPLVASRALLQPCLHDEAYAYLRCVQRTFFTARQVLWNSAGEQALGLRLYGPGIGPNSIVVGEGVESLPLLRDTAEINALSALRPFLLVLGRKDHGKGTFLAVEAFRLYRRRIDSSLNLLIAGPGEANFGSPEDHIHDLGLVSENVRSWLLQNTIALIQPSPNESFSRVIFEAWFCGRPVVARQSCLATAQAVLTSGGGWVAESVKEWVEVFGQLDSTNSETLSAAGKRGAMYAAEVADWSRVMDRYDAVLRPLLQRPTASFTLRLAFTTNKVQQIQLLNGQRKIGAWDLAPGEVCDTGWIETELDEAQPVLRFESDTLPSNSQLDPRILGFNLQRFEIRREDSAELTPRFSSGWNRSEGGIGSHIPRWSTRTAEIVIQPRVQHPRARAIHQVLPNLGYGDAIGNHTIWLRDQLQSLGFVSEIFARHIAEKMLHQAHPYSGPDALPPDAAIIYHHSIGTEITPWVCLHPGPKALIYHNITPANFCQFYRPEFAEILRRGREDLPKLAPFFSLSVGDSRFNADELSACGFANPGVLPIPIDLALWGSPPDEALMGSLQDGRTNILFVGRIVPNKRHEDLIYTFKFWLEEDPEARLFLVGTAEVASYYLECLQELARRLRVDHAVHFVGHITESQLHAYYRCASMFWCFSEHEGFCVPIIEACAFGVPVVARAEGAVPDTLGDAGQLLPKQSNPAQTARLIAANRSTDPSKLRARIEHYCAANTLRQLQQLVDELLESQSPASPMESRTPALESITP